MHNYSFQQSSAIFAKHARNSTSIAEVPQASSWHSFRNKRLSKDISVEAKDIINKSWSLGTSKQYSVYLNRWFCYCQQKDICPTDYNIIEGINFLTEIFYSDSLGYSAMNTARSALSAIMINE